MIVKAIMEENFNHYKKPSMLIGFARCTFKCDIECGEQVCQNSTLAKAPDILISISDIVQRYLNNNLTSALVCGGLEPFDSYDDLKMFISYIREFTKDDVVIYTGYTMYEVSRQISELRKYENIIVKFGRFIPNQEKHFDDILGVFLASENQYAERIS